MGIAPQRIWIDGFETTTTEAARAYNTAPKTVRRKVKVYGDRLTSEQMEDMRKSSQKAKAKYESAGRVGPEKMARLAKIPSPTQLEYELWGVKI